MLLQAVITRHQSRKSVLEALPFTKDPLYSFVDKIAYSKIDIAGTGYSTTYQKTKKEVQSIKQSVLSDFLVLYLYCKGFRIVQRFDNLSKDTSLVSVYRVMAYIRRRQPTARVPSVASGTIFNGKLSELK